MQLLEVLKNIDYELISGDLNKEITSVEYDSRKVSVGSLFVCVKGFTVDGHSYAKSAAEKDASAIVVDSTRDGFQKEELDQLAKEYDLGADFLDRYMEILDSRIYLFQVIEFMIMRREKGLRPFAVFMDILHDRPGDGHAVVGRSSAADLVQQYQRPRREVVQYHRCFQHLDHESRFSQ